MTSREWQVYNIIKEKSLQGQKTTQRELCDLVEGLEYNEDITAHDHCSTIWNIINEINNSDEIDKIIISDNFEYWIGDEEETIEYLNTLWGRIVPKLKRYYNLLRKTKLDGQGKLLSNQLQPIDENSQARPYHEVYIK